jgi:diguanylate cyclase (GGDEF)-like protein/PAS domain S-box-containing protein
MVFFIIERFIKFNEGTVMVKGNQDMQNRFNPKMILVVILLSSIPILTFSILEVSMGVISENEDYVKTAHFLGFAVAFIIIFIISMIIGQYIRAVNDKKVLVATLELKHITNSIHAGVVNFLLEKNYGITYASDGFYDIIGYSKEEVEKNNNSILKFIHEEDIEKFQFPIHGFRIGDYIQKEFRIRTKSQEIRWILFNGNYSEGKDGHTISAVLVDITESRQMHERLLVEEQRYRVATEISNDILFEYDIKKDYMKYAERYRDLYNMDPSIPDFTGQYEFFEKIIHPEDIGLFIEYCKSLGSGKALIEAEFRLLDKNNNYVWCHLCGKTIYDEKMQPIKVIGKLVNIDLYKKDFEVLEYKAKRDPLTGVYNRNVVEDLINEYIEKNKEQQHTFMVVDIDDFKNINDQYGHQRGDKVLSFAINQVKLIFSSDEIIGRIGGDEFVVFIGDTTDEEMIFSKADILHKALQTVYHDNGFDISLSGSIGISTYPKDGQNYEELFERADHALYDVKEGGKDGYKLFA